MRRTHATVLFAIGWYFAHAVGAEPPAGVPARAAAPATVPTSPAPGEVRQFGRPEVVDVEGTPRPLAVLSIAFSPDGRTALSVTTRAVRLWDVSTGRELRAWEAGADDKTMTRAAVFSPDGKRVLGFGLTIAHERSAGWMTLWDAGTGAVVRRFDGQPSGTSDAAFSPDGRRIAAAGGNGYEHDASLWLWDARTGERLRAFPGVRETSPPGAVAFTPDGRHLLTNAGKGLTVYDVETGEAGRELPGAARARLAVSPDGKWVVGSTGGRVLLWDFRTGELLRTLAWEPGSDPDRPGFAEGADLRDVALVPGPAGRTLAVTASFKGPMLWDLETGRLLLRLRGHDRYAEHVAVSPDGRYALTGGDDGTVRLWGLPER